MGNVHEIYIENIKYIRFCWFQINQGTYIFCGIFHIHLLFGECIVLIVPFVPFYKIFFAFSETEIEILLLLIKVKWIYFGKCSLVIQLKT